MQRYTVYLSLETALHVSGGISTYHQEHIQLYLQHLALVKPLLLPAALVEEFGTGFHLFISGNCSTCFGWIHHQEHIQLYLHNLALVKPLFLPVAIVEGLEMFQFQLHEAKKTLQNFL